MDPEPCSQQYIQEHRTPYSVCMYSTAVYYETKTEIEIEIEIEYMYMYIADVSPISIPNSPL